MPITYDITKDYLYNKGIEQGIEQKTRQMVLKALDQGILTIAQIAEMTGVPAEHVLQLKRKHGK